MSSEVTTFNPGGALSADMASVFDTDALAGDLTEGAGGGGFQSISIRGSKWRVKTKDGEFPIMNADGEPSPSIEVILLKSSKQISKIYYAEKYTEGDDAAPTCFSLDGVTPDPSSEKVQAKSCDKCRRGEWGSRITDAGKKAKECGDTRRIAIQLLTTPSEEVDTEEPMLLRIPAASLNDLVVYGTALGRKGCPYNAIVTRLGFDVNAAYPKLTFKAARRINNDEATEVTRLFHSDTLANILSAQAVEKPAEKPAEIEKKPPVSSTVDVDFDEGPTPPTVPKKKAAKKKAAAKQEDSNVTSIDDQANKAAGDDLDNIMSDLESLA